MWGRDRRLVPSPTVRNDRCAYGRSAASATGTRRSKEDTCRPTPVFSVADAQADCGEGLAVIRSGAATDRAAAPTETPAKQPRSFADSTASRDGHRRAPPRARTPRPRAGAPRQTDPTAHLAAI